MMKDQSVTERAVIVTVEIIMENFSIRYDCLQHRIYSWIEMFKSRAFRDLTTIRQSLVFGYQNFVKKFVVSLLRISHFLRRDYCFSEQMMLPSQHRKHTTQ